MPNEPGSVYKPTFVYRRKEMKPKGGGKTKEKLPPMPLATDLHIRFTKGGVTVTDIGGAERPDVCGGRVALAPGDKQPHAMRLRGQARGDGPVDRQQPARIAQLELHRCGVLPQVKGPPPGKTLERSSGGLDVRPICHLTNRLREAIVHATRHTDCLGR